MASHSGSLDGPFLTAVASSLDLLGLPEVAARWTADSVLPEMSVGALACHLGRQTVRAAEVLGAEADLPALVSAEEHYRRSAWVTATSPDDPVNDRTSVDEEAAQGRSALLARTAAALDAVPRLLSDRIARDVVPLPWQSWSLSRADFLLTRLVELVVDTDDLALSVGVPAPESPDEVFGPFATCW